MYNAKRCFFTILLCLGCPTFHPVSVVMCRNLPWTWLGTLIDRPPIMFSEAFSMVSVWASNLLADSGPLRGINPQPSRTPRSSMTFWPIWIGRLCSCIAFCCRWVSKATFRATDFGLEQQRYQHGMASQTIKFKPWDKLGLLIVHLYSWRVIISTV